MKGNLLLGGLIFSFLASNALASEVVWNFNNQAIALGTGCNSRFGDTFFVASGNQISVVMTSLGIDLASYGAPVSARKNCRVRIPTMISNGIYVGELTQTIGYGVAKTAYSTVDITTSASWNTPGSWGSISRSAASPIKIHYGLGRDLTNSALTARAVDDYSVFKPSWCATPGFYTMFNLDLAVAGTAGFSDYSGFNYDGAVTSQIDGADLRWDAVAGIYYCNQ